jgi:hypothetical protein
MPSLDGKLSILSMHYAGNATYAAAARQHSVAAPGIGWWVFPQAKFSRTTSNS